MKTKTFSEELREARKHRYAVGAFNIFNYQSAKAVIRAASSLNCPVILQTSVTTVKELGPMEFGAALRQLAWNAPVNVLIHLDHCRSIELAKECIDAGWDSVMFDGSHLPLEENIECCKEVVKYAHPRGIQVEGELGRIVGVEDDIQVDVGDATGAKLDESVYFVRESGIDALAPAIGTAHGVYKGKPNIDFELVTQLSAAMETPIVIHGGTGLSEETFNRLIVNGGAKVNVSTALKHAYIDAGREYLEQNPEKYDPLALDRALSRAVENTAKEHMAMFRRSMM